MIRPRNMDPGQYPHPNHLIFGMLLDNPAYWVTAGQSLALANAPAGFVIPLSAGATRPLAMAQSVSITTAGATTNGDMTLRVSGLNQFAQTVTQDYFIVSGTVVGVIVPTALNISTKVFRKVTGVQVVSNANTAATTVSIGTTTNNAQFKFGVPVKLAKVAEAVRVVYWATIAGTNNLIGSNATTDITNNAIFVGAIATAGFTIVCIQVDMLNVGMRG